MDTFGIATSIEAMPEGDFATASHVLYTALPGGEFAAGQEVTGAILANILKAGEDNDARGRLPVYGVSYVTFRDGTTYMGEGVCLSLYEVMHLAEEFAYSESLVSFYTTWEDPMKTWNFVRLGK